MHPFHKSSFRPQLVMGAEREPMLMLVLVAVVLAISLVFNPSWILLIGTITVWSFGQFLLIWMAKIDPQMLSVFRRLRQYPGYIPPHTTPFRKPANWWWW